MAQILEIIVCFVIFIPMLIDKIQGDYVNMVSFIASIALVGMAVLVMFLSIVLAGNKMR